MALVRNTKARVTTFESLIAEVLVDNFIIFLDMVIDVIVRVSASINHNDISDGLITCIGGLFFFLFLFRDSDVADRLRSVFFLLCCILVDELYKRIHLVLFFVKVKICGFVHYFDKS